MMKIFKHPFGFGIRGKIWLAMVGLVAVTLILVYILGVVFLEKRYYNDKKANVTEVLNTTISKVKSQEDIYLLDEFLTNLALKNNICIDISNINGISLLTYEGAGVNCFTHSMIKNKRDLVTSIYGNINKTVIAQVLDNKENTNFFVAGQFLETKKADYIILTTASLSSVSDATSIVSRQIFEIAGYLFVISTFVAFFVSGFITRPVKKLTVAVNQVASGNLLVSMPFKDNKNNEFSKLARSFNIMVKKIRQSEIMQKELIANVSHDLKTPLTMVKGYAELIKDITGDDKVKRDEQLDIIIEETDRLSELVKDIMDLSLMQAGVKPLNYTQFDIIKLIKKVCTSFAFYEETFGYRINLNTVESFLINADESRIEQVLYNLVNNAFTHIGEDKTVYLNALFHEDNKLKIEIIDNGYGIPPDELAIIWERYYKPFRTPKGENKGTGLGLSIVKANLTALNYDFGVHSIVNEGSNFWFII